MFVVFTVVKDPFNVQFARSHSHSKSTWADMKKLTLVKSLSSAVFATKPFHKGVNVGLMKEYTLVKDLLLVLIARNHSLIRVH